MKKTSVLVIALIIVMAFASLMVACSSEDKRTTDTAQQTTEVQKNVKTEAVSEEATSGVDEERTATTAATETETEDTKATTATKETPNTEATKSNTSSGTGSGSATGTNSEQSTKASTEVTEATKAEKFCYITVDGYCADKKIEIKGGESVYDILKKTGASVSARNTGYGVYVEGINGRFEFDEGPTSGWVYTVNGNRVNVSCDGCDVKSGDKIVWKYVTE